MAGWEWFGAFYKSAFLDVVKVYVPKPAQSLIGKAWSAEYAWAQRHPTITSVAVGMAVTAAAVALAPLVLPASIGAAGVTMIGGGIGAALGTSAQYLSNAHLTKTNVSLGEIARQTILAGSIGMLTAGLGAVIAKAFTPVAAQLVASTPARKALVTATSEIVANGSVKGTVAMHQKVIDNVVENYEHDKPLLTDVGRDVPTEVAKEVGKAALEGVGKAALEGVGEPLEAALVDRGARLVNPHPQLRAAAVAGARRLADARPGIGIPGAAIAAATTVAVKMQGDTPPPPPRTHAQPTSAAAPGAPAAHTPDSTPATPEPQAPCKGLTDALDSTRSGDAPAATPTPTPTSTQPAPAATPSEPAPAAVAPAAPAARDPRSAAAKALDETAFGE